MSRSAVVIKINGDAAQFKNELKKVEGDTKELSANLTKVGAVASVAFVGLTAAIFGSVGAFREQMKVERQTEALLRSTGHAAGVTAQEVFALGTALQKVTNFGDETVISAQNMILKFSNLGKDILPQVTELALDFAQFTGTDATAAAHKLGRALNDPIKGMTQLQEAGVSFTDEQKKLIKALVESGRASEAQAIMLGLLQKAYGGQARAAADPMIQLQGVLGDIAQEIGRVFAPALLGAASALKDMAFFLLEQNPQLIKYTAYALGAATAIAGLTAALTLGAALYLKVTAIWVAYSASAGIAVLATKAFAGACTVAGVAVKFLLGPWGLLLSAVVALGVVMYQNREKIIAFFAGIKAAFSTFTAELSKFAHGAATVLSGIFTANPAKVKEGLTALREAASSAGSSAAEAFATAYNESLMKQELAKVPSEPNSELLPQAPGSGELAIDTEGLDLEKKKEKKKAELTLEQEYQEELRKLRDEYNQLDAAAEDMHSVEIQKKQNDEKKTRLLEEQKYGQGLASVKAFWRKEEVKGTQELFGELSTLTRSKNRQLFQIGKAAAIANAIVNVAQGVTRTLGAYPFPLNAALAAAVGVAGAVQISTISGQTLNAQKGWSGSGSPFGESFVSTFTPREIVVPERFSEGIKKGDFSLTSNKEESPAGAGEMQVIVGFQDDASEFLEVKSIERRKLGVSIG